MARLPRFCPAGLPQHIIQRGNNRSTCFASEQDFAAYANWLKEYAQQFDVAVHAWVFMTNHVHLLVTPATDNGVSLLMQSLGRRYVQYFNYRHKRTGTLWEGRFRSCLVDSQHYLLACYRYIELNPVRAKMVSHPSAYKWSSYHCNALGVATELCTPHEEYIALGKQPARRCINYQALFDTAKDSELALTITAAATKGMALGNVDFKTRIERLYGHRVSKARMGRPKTLKSCI